MVSMRQLVRNFTYVSSLDVTLSFEDVLVTGALLGCFILLEGTAHVADVFPHLLNLIFELQGLCKDTFTVGRFAGLRHTRTEDLLEELVIGTCLSIHVPIEFIFDDFELVNDHSLLLSHLCQVFDVVHVCLLDVL